VCDLNNPPLAQVLRLVPKSTPSVDLTQKQAAIFRAACKLYNFFLQYYYYLVCFSNLLPIIIVKNGKKINLKCSLWAQYQAFA
jgi:hypothetical protein